MTTIPLASPARLRGPAEWSGDVAYSPCLPPGKPTKVHLPALDGVRAIAILMVIVYHSLNGLPGMTWSQNVVMRLASQGWAGVDLFFVLS